MRPVAALFVRRDSIYKQIEGVDAYDIDRGALTWPGGVPGVYHPPCRAWGRLSHMAKPAPHEKDLARWSVRQVRRWGGVLEHPQGSRLWQDQKLPEPGARDEHDGWTLVIAQWWWGHRAEKMTRLYIVGCAPKDTPVMPLRMGRATHTIASSTARQRRGHPDFRPEVTKPEREHTPPDLAHWLVELARRCNVEQREAA